MGQLTQKVPKCMLPLEGKPLLEYTISWLRGHGIREVIINVHYLADQVRSYFGDGQGLGVNILYSEEEELLGTAGALERMRTHLRESFLVVYGDLLTNIDLGKLLGWHKAKGASLSMVTYDIEDPTRAGIVATDSEGRLTKFKEKPSPDEVFSTRANAGVFVFEPEVLRYIPKSAYSDIGADLLPILLQNNVRVCCYPLDGYLLDIGSPERYSRAQSDLVNRRVYS